MDKKRFLGEHLTPREVSREYILPEVRGVLHDYIWVDMFAGRGDLLLPILELLPRSERAGFFERHVYLFDIQEEMVEEAIENAVSYGVPRAVAERNISQRDSLRDYPRFLLEKGLPVYHITNPPYLYIGYIAKHRETQRLLEYFRGENQGLQDLYQVALVNDARHGVERMAYIVPTNFLYGYSVSNRVRDLVLRLYRIRKAVVFEKTLFESTGTHVMLCFFEKKDAPGHEVQVFEGIKIGLTTRRRTYVLSPRNHYRAGGEFDEFIERFRSPRPLAVRFYLTIEEVEKNRGDIGVSVIDVNSYDGRAYRRTLVYVNRELYEKIVSNILFIKTLDTGGPGGRAGLYVIREVFGVDGVLVTRAAYRTHPVHVFLEPRLSREEQLVLRDYFNTLLEYFRELTDSEFMTTYKYSESLYTRKYLGLRQARGLIETFPWLELGERERERLREYIERRDPGAIIEFLKKSRAR